MLLVLSTCALLISVMLSANGTQFLNITLIPLWFGIVAVLVFGVAIVSLASMCASI